MINKVFVFSLILFSFLMPVKAIQEKASKDCQEFPDALQTCSPRECTLTNLLTGTLTMYKIKGVVNGKCNYELIDKEQGINMQCKLPMDSLILLSNSFSELLNGNANSNDPTSKILENSCVVE